MSVSDSGVIAVVSGATDTSDTVSLDGNAGIISVGMSVTGIGMPVGTTVTVVSSQSFITLSSKASLTDNAILTFKLPTGITVSSVTSQTNITLSSEISLTDNTNLNFEISESNGPFVDGEEITGGTSGASALILDTGRPTDGSNVQSPMTYILIGGTDFVDGEVITGEAKIDSSNNTVYATATINSFRNIFINSPDSIWTEFRIETVIDHNGILLESGNAVSNDAEGRNIENQLTSINSIKLTSDITEEIVLEEAGFYREIDIISEKLILDGTDTTVNASGRTNAGGYIVDEASGDIIILEGDGVSFVVGYEENKEYFDIALGINGESGDEQKENSGESISSSFRTTKW